MARKILLADDDEAVREGLDRLLRFEGYETVLTGDGREALELVAGVDERPDLVLMDVTMPGLDGLAATRRIRASGSTVPIRLARVRALLRRSPQPKQCAPRLDDRLAFADLAMDRPTRTVTRCDRPLVLTRTEYALLEYLLRHPAKVLSRAQILKEVWGFDFEPTSNTLDVYVMYLRRKLESRGEPRLIQTVRGLGYTLRAAK
ncbi:response regulator transcription factor [Streptomyces mirabilis]|uniref:response regulator transcription factor n=1 Tax=Streptomyces mirabilis TaxID=68239 RepID=UPI0032559701